ALEGERVAGAQVQAAPGEVLVVAADRRALVGAVGPQEVDDAGRRAAAAEVQERAGGVPVGGAGDVTAEFAGDVDLSPAAGGDDAGRAGAEGAEVAPPA